MNSKTQKLTTNEKIQELRQWILNGEDFYNSALTAQYNIQKNELNQEELTNALTSFAFKVAETANIFIKPSEIEPVNEAVYNIIMRIDV